MTTTIAEDDHLTGLFAALASTTRRAILARLAEGEATVNELAAPFDLTLPAVSKHLTVLEDAGLIVRGRRAQFRPCTLNPAAVAAVASWAEQYRSLWDASLDRMDSYLRQLDSKGTKR